MITGKINLRKNMIWLLRRHIYNKSASDETDYVIAI